MGSADDRRFEVLRAIVADFVSTKEPIGSKTLVERHNLGVSSATVRNDMAVLEAEGYITQPHTSSGRVPTEKGYREFVDRIDDVKPLSSSERRAILSFLESGVDLDDVLRRAVRLLAQLTRQVAIVQYPTLSRSTVRHLEVVALTPARLLLVVITDTGRVDQRVVELGDAIGEHELSQLRERLGAALEGKLLSAASIAVADLASQMDGHGGLGDAVGRAATVLGLIGAGGVGQVLLDSVNAFQYDQTGCIVLVIVVAVSLIDLLEYYGFAHTATKPDGELIYEKSFSAAKLDRVDGLSDFELDRLNYPRFLVGPDVRAFGVPIVEDYHDTLYPDLMQDRGLF